MRQVITFNNKNLALPVVVIPYNDNAYIQFPANSTNKEDSAWFVGPNIKNTDTIEIKFKADSWNQWRQMLGCNFSDDEYFEFQFSIYPASGGQYFGQNFWNYGNTSRIANDYMFPVTSNEIHIMKIQVGTGNVDLDGTTYTGQGTNAAGTSYDKLQFGCAPAGWADPGFLGKIYYVKIIDSNNNVTFYAHAVNNDVAGFFDSVSQTVLTKGGTGTVTYGED